MLLLETGSSLRLRVFQVVTSNERRMNMPNVPSHVRGAYLTREVDAHHGWVVKMYGKLSLLRRKKKKKKE